MFLIRACHQHAAVLFPNLAGDRNDMSRRLPRTENHLRKSFSQTAVGIDLRKAQIDYRGCLKRAQYPAAFHAAFSERVE